MAAQVAGALEVQIFAGIARLQKDMNDAKTVVGGAMKNVESAVASAKNALGTLGIGLGVGYFVSLIKGTVGAISALDDLAETTGASVGELSKLAQQARISGVDMGTVEMALVRLSKSMNATDEESKKATRALDALGLKAADLKNMDTAQQLQIVAVAMNKFGDSSGKTALAMDLFGKTGAKVLPFLKDMANDGELAATVTAEQAAKAEELEKAVRRLGNEFSNFKQAIMIDAVPALLEWVEANAKAIKIAGGVSEMLRLFVFNLNAMTTEKPGEQIRRLTKEIAELGAEMQKPWWKQGAGSVLFGERDVKDKQKQVEFLKYLQAQAALNGRTGPQFMDARDLALQQKTTLNYVAIDEKAIAAAKAAAAKAAAEKKKLLDADMKGWVAFADFQIDEYEKELKELEKMSDEHWKNEEKLRQEDIKGWVAYAEAIVQADFDEAKQLADIQSKTTDEIMEFWRSAAQSMQSSMSDFFFDIMQGKITDLGSNFKRTIDRMMSDMIAAQAAMALFGKDFGKGGSIGGLVGKAVDWVGGKFSGTQSPAPVAEMSFGGAQARGGDYMVTRPTLFLAGEAGPERATFSGANRSGSGTVNNFTVDMRGASVEAVTRLERLVMRVNGSIESRAVAATTDWSRRR